MDFEPFLLNFVGLPTIDGSLRQCFTLPITDDDIEEPDESFRVFLRRLSGFTSDNIMFSTPEANVTIVDNDRRKIMNEHSY